VEKHSVVRTRTRNQYNHASHEYKTIKVEKPPDAMALQLQLTTPIANIDSTKHTPSKTMHLCIPKTSLLS
jgi:hypothetical protein